MCDHRPKPFWFRPLGEKGALHLHQLAAVHFNFQTTFDMILTFLSLALIRAAQASAVFGHASCRVNQWCWGSQPGSFSFPLGA